MSPRRFREFVALDEKLQQFYGSLRTSLPPRKTVGNMNKEFLEKRRAQLQKYLMVGQMCLLCNVTLIMFMDAYTYTYTYTYTYCTHTHTQTHTRTHTYTRTHTHTHTYTHTPPPHTHLFCFTSNCTCVLAQDLVMNEDTSDNQLLLSFLTDTSDTSQFTPHSRAGVCACVCVCVCACACS